jgi:hypothetical protein
MDTKFFYEALRIWQQRKQVFRTYERLTQEQRGEIMRDAQDLKKKALTIDEVLDGSRRSQ